VRELHVFNHVSLDGYFVDSTGDMSWAHGEDPEFQAFTQENASGQAAMLFGRVTYQMMAGFWPTPAAAQMMPDVAASMNAAPKYVFSRSLTKVEWENTTLLKGDILAETRRLKAESGPDLLIMGSGTIVSQLTEAGLVDAYQIVVNPLVLGSGRTMFEGVTRRVNLTLEKSRTFKNGKVVLWYSQGHR
jgi:dihydrofolate reductase